MLLGRGYPTVFLTRPVSLTLLLVAVAILTVLLPSFCKKQDEAFVEVD
jgi:putative tricarboxylic transport membrane protein